MGSPAFDPRLRSAKSHGFALALSLFVAAAAVYAPVLRAGFLHDDDELLTANPIVRRGGGGLGAESWAGLRELWLPSSGTFTRSHLPGIPVTATALWIEWRLWGTGDPQSALGERGIGAPGYHVVNVLLHVWCALLLWSALARLAIPGAWWAALLWAVHPVGVESVAWISELKNTLSMVFLLASFSQWLRWTDEQTRGAWWRALFAFLLALLSKPAAVPFPLALLLLGWWRRRPLAAELRATLPFFALAFVGGAFTIYTQSALAIGEEPIAVGAPLERIYQAAFALGFYVWKALLPFDLVVVYPRWHETLPWLVQLAPGLLAAALLLASWRARERWGRPVIAGFGGYVVMLGPVLGLVPMSYMRHTLVADHFQYQALPFLIALIVGSAVATRPRWATRAPCLTASAAIAVVLAWHTLSYAAMFHDRDTLWKHVLAMNPDSWAAHDQAGLRQMADGRPRLALAHFERDVALAPDRTEVRNNFAVLLDQLGEHDRALEQILKAAELSPSSGPVQINCAMALLATGRAREAIPHFAAAQALLPADPSLHVSYGTALLAAGRPRDAIDQLRRALALDPNRPRARTLLAAAQTQLAAAPR